MTDSSSNKFFFCVYDEATAEYRTHTSASHGIWFVRNWHIVLPDDSTQVPKHAAETHLMYVLIINCVFGWYQ